MPKEASPALRELICDLATRLPYRQTAEVASRITGEPLSPQSTWRLPQAEGARIRDEEDRLVASVFELGQAPPDHALAPELVGGEADGTMVRAHREGQPSFEVKTGVFHTGKQRAGGRRHRRWRLLNKGCYATSADADVFGKGLAALGFHWVGGCKERPALPPRHCCSTQIEHGTFGMWRTPPRSRPASLTASLLVWNEKESWPQRVPAPIVCAA